MKEFSYTITDPLGIHARPAGMLVKCARAYESRITISKENRTADAKRLLSVMGLGIRCGDTVQVRADGADETAAAKGLQAFLEENL